MNEICDWIIQNKEWVFSGIGITALGIFISAFKILFGKKTDSVNKQRDNYKQINTKGGKGTIIGTQNNYYTKEDMKNG